MSRIGKKIIEIPKGAEASVSGAEFVVKGPKGTLKKAIPSAVEVVIEGSTVKVTKKPGVVQEKALWGTFASHLINLVDGATKGFEKKLIIEGIGYKADVKGTNLVLALGFSHPVNIPIPEGLKVVSDKGVLTMTGPDKEVLGQFAAQIRSLKKPEPYKGKGIRYDAEIIRRKQGKKTA